MFLHFGVAYAAQSGRLRGNDLAIMAVEIGLMACAAISVYFWVVALEKVFKYCPWLWYPCYCIALVYTLFCSAILGGFI